MTEDDRKLVGGLRYAQKLYEDAGVDGVEGALKARQAADRIEALSARIAELEADLEKCRHFEMYTLLAVRMRARRHALLEAADMVESQAPVTHDMNDTIIAEVCIGIADQLRAMAVGDDDD